MVGDLRNTRRSPRRFHRLRETEVQHLHHAVGADLDVRGLQIAVDDPLFVGRFESVGDSCDRQRLLDGITPRAM